MKTTYTKILDVAEQLTQTVGYNAFSYHDIAAKVGIKTASIHYYFPTKADLGKAMIKKHVDLMMKKLDLLINNQKLSCKKKLELFLDAIFEETYRANRKMCLGGMLASDVLTLPDTVQHEVKLFFKKIELWLKNLLTKAIELNEFKLSKRTIAQEAMAMLAMIEGALLLARLFHDEAHLTVVKKDMMDRFNK